MGLALATSTSGNRKIGLAATTHVAQSSCPSSCVFKDGGGCYAESGNQGFVTSRLNTFGGSPIDAALAEAAAIDALDAIPGRPMRLHTVGDCATDVAARIVSRAAERYMRRGGGPAWTYTHGWRDVDRGSWGAVSVFASCETDADVHEANALGYAACLVVERFWSEKRYSSHAELAWKTDAEMRQMAPPVSVVPCPAQTHDDVKCSSCKLCFDADARLAAGVTVGFELHGEAFTVRAAKKALRDPDDPERRLSSEQLARRLYARILGEGREPRTRDFQLGLGMSQSSAYQWLAFVSGRAPHPSDVRRGRKIASAHNVR